MKSWKLTSLMILTILISENATAGLLLPMYKCGNTVLKEHVGAPYCNLVSCGARGARGACGGLWSFFDMLLVEMLSADTAKRMSAKCHNFSCLLTVMCEYWLWNSSNPCWCCCCQGSEENMASCKKLCMFWHFERWHFSCLLAGMCEQVCIHIFCLWNEGKVICLIYYFCFLLRVFFSVFLLFSFSEKLKNGVQISLN